MCNVGRKLAKRAKARAGAKARPAGRRNLSAAAESLGLPEGYIVTRYARGEGCDRACPRCGCEGHVNGHYRSRVWHTPTRGAAQLCLMLHQVRLRCPECGKCWSDGHEDLLSAESRHMTASLAEGIRWDLMLRKSVKECSATWRPSRHLVNKVVESAFVDWQYLPMTLCIDEFKADTDAGMMAIGVYDGDAGRIIEVLPNMSRETVDAFFDGFTERQRRVVRFFSCDMSGEMVSVQQRWFPQAKLCIARFHVIKLANRALSDVRKRVQDDPSIDPRLSRELKDSWRFLVIGKDKLRRLDDEYAMELAERRARIQTALSLTDEELDSIPGCKAREPRERKLKRLLALSEELRVAYELCHTLRDVHSVLRLRWHEDATEQLDRWRYHCRRSGIPEMVQCAATIRRHQEGILNSYRYGRTNAVAEGINNSIKVTKRRGYGIRRFSAFRHRIPLAMGLGKAEVVRLTLHDVGRKDEKEEDEA